MYRPRRFEVAIPLTMYLDQRSEDAAGDPIRVTLDLTVPGAVDADDHHHLLTRGQAASIARRLTETADERPEVELVVQDDGCSIAYTLPAVETRALAVGLDEALRDLEVHPPREDARGMGWLEAATSEGATLRLGVDVEVVTSGEGDVRSRSGLGHRRRSRPPRRDGLDTHERASESLSPNEHSETLRRHRLRQGLPGV